FDVVAKKEVVVAKVEAAIGDDGVRPCRAFAALGGFEAARFLVACRRCLDQGDLAVLFAAHLKPTIRRPAGTLAHPAGFPFGRAGIEAEAARGAFVGAEERIADEDTSAVMVGQDLADVLLFGGDAIALSDEPKQCTATAAGAGGGAEDQAVMKYGRRTIGIAG